MELLMADRDRLPSAARAGIRAVAVPALGAAARSRHEIATLGIAAARIAGLLGVECRTHLVGEAEAGECFCIPVDTLSREVAARHGLLVRDRLWGGVVPADFVATKLVSHPRWNAASVTPPEWRRIPGIEACTLPGYSVFDRESARAAGIELLRGGDVRIKRPSSRGGHGQSVVRDRADLHGWLDAVCDPDIAEGLVVERDLARSRTYGVGSSTLPGHAIAYVGTQSTTTDRSGHEVYAGSCLHVHAGRLDDLARAPLDPEVREVVAVAMRYDRRVRGCYGVVATRCNYDVIVGEDAHGRRHVGVLEQSWRYGGASMAEVLAMERLAERPDLRGLRAETVETYAHGAPPADAVVTWDGRPDYAAPLKYARIIDDGCFP